MNTQNTELMSRIDDLCRIADRGEVVYTAFLSPADARAASDILVYRGLKGRFILSGGWGDADRVRIFILPEHLFGFADLERYTDAISLPEELMYEVGAAMHKSLVPLLICGSGYRVLSHRDYLGAVLSLGIERDAVGDVAQIDDYSALLITSDKIAELIMSDLCRVGSDAVKVKIIDEHKIPHIEKKLQDIRDTIASERLDCIVSAVTGLAREKAQTLIKSGLVQLDCREVQSPDMRVDPPATLTVRGHGKYEIYSFDGTTKKGRLRLVGAKYI